MMIEFCPRGRMNLYLDEIMYGGLGFCPRGFVPDSCTHL